MGRLTVATYANVHDELRKVYAKTKDAKEHSFKAGDFSYNTGKLRCPICDGTVPMEDICRWIDERFLVTASKQRKQGYRSPKK